MPDTASKRPALIDQALTARRNGPKQLEAVFLDRIGSYANTSFCSTAILCVMREKLLEPLAGS
eukprot:8134864-Alexandrium_andersonii.AAC.1